MPGQNTAPELHNQVAQIWTELRRLRTTVAGGGFDPNESPVLIGEGSTAGGGSTPSNVSAGDDQSVVIGRFAHMDHVNQVSIGESAWAGTGSSNVSVGCFASADGTQGTALGNSAQTSGDGTNTGQVAVGSGARSMSTGSIAIGDSAVATADSSNEIAIGVGTSAAHDKSIALGFNAATDRDHQAIVAVTILEVGAAASGVVALRSPNGTRWQLSISNAGGAVITAVP